MTRVAVVAQDGLVAAGLAAVLRRAPDLVVVPDNSGAEVLVLDVWPPAAAAALCRHWRSCRPAARLVAILHRPTPHLAESLGAVLWPKDADPRGLPIAVRAAARLAPPGVRRG